MALYDTAGGQYTAVTGRRRRFPYGAFIESQIPSLYQSRQREENREFADAQLSLEEQAIEESSRASNAALAENIRTSDIQAGLKREEIAAQEKQAQTAALISGAQTAGLGYYGASKLGLFGGKTAAAAVPAGTAATAGTAGTAANVAGSQIASTGSQILSGLGTAGLAIGAGTLVDRFVGDKVKEAGPATTGAIIGGTAFGPPGALIGAGIGAVAKPIADFTLDVGEKVGKEAINFGKSVWDKGSDIVGTWLCTKTKEVVGMTDEEWSIIGEFRKYAKGHYDNGLAWYIEVGPELIESINGNAGFYKELKGNFLEPVIGLTRGGYPEIAFSVYKSVVIALAEKWNPGLLKTLPEEYRG